MATRHIGIALALAAAAARAAPTDEEARFTAAIAEFEKGLGGDSSANERAHDAFEQLVAAQPARPLYLAYLGASSAVLGRDAWAPWTKMKRTEDGLALLEKSLALAGAQGEADAQAADTGLRVRLIAATTFLAVPSLFHRFEAGKATLQVALASPALAHAPPEVHARLLYQSALAARREERRDDEKAALVKLSEVWPSSPLASAAQKRLAELGR
jgi:hypothetical protein